MKALKHIRALHNIHVYINKFKPINIQKSQLTNQSCSNALNGFKLFKTDFLQIIQLL